MTLFQHAWEGSGAQNLRAAVPCPVQPGFTLSCQHSWRGVILLSGALAQIWGGVKGPNSSQGCHGSSPSCWWPHREERLQGAAVCWWCPSPKDSTTGSDRPADQAVWLHPDITWITAPFTCSPTPGSHRDIPFPSGLESGLWFKQRRSWLWSALFCTLIVT